MEIEKNLLTIIVFILIIVLAAVVVYRSISMFLKPPSKKDYLPESRSVKDEYKKIIEKSKSDYQTFMDKKDLLP